MNETSALLRSIRDQFSEAEMEFLAAELEQSSTKAEKLVKLAVNDPDFVAVLKDWAQARMSIKLETSSTAGLTPDVVAELERCGADVAEFERNMTAYLATKDLLGEGTWVMFLGGRLHAQSDDRDSVLEQAVRDCYITRVGSEKSPPVRI
jgi:hypothetical protein